MSKVNYRELKRQAKQARVFVKPIIYDPKDSANNKNVPTDHQEKFAVIQALGRTPYFTYGYFPSNETPDKPWQLENKKRANFLIHRAAKCRKENRNEAGWRYEVEVKLFERFDIEVAWLVHGVKQTSKSLLTFSSKRCRKRLWRSEIESNPASSNSRTTSLAERQRKRELCKCNPAGRLDDL
jgi:hypothetical protein